MSTPIMREKKNLEIW